MQYNWGGDLDDHLMSLRIFTLTINKDIHINSINYERNGCGYDWFLLINSQFLCV